MSQVFPGGSVFFYHYDGLGSTRSLSDNTGTFTDGYDYEAFGELTGSTGSTDNSYLFTGEQFDSGLDSYYLRARYYDQGIGRFTQMDTFQGINEQPLSLNKYLYAEADVLNLVDPSGLCANPRSRGNEVQRVIEGLYRDDHPGDNVLTNRSLKTAQIAVSRLRPDIINLTQSSYAEIKPLSLSGIATGKLQTSIYDALIGNQLDRDRWEPSDSFTACGRPVFAKNVNGLIFYTDDDSIRENVLTASTLAAIAAANRISRKPSSGFLRPTLARATSLLNTSQAFAARQTALNIKTALSLRAPLVARFGF